MPREFSRSRRVEEQILRLLAELVRREVKDPRVGPVTLTAVEVSRDLSHAKVYFLPFDAARDPRQVGEALAAASGFLRSLLRKQLSMRQVPSLHFVPDESIDRAAQLSALINTAVARDHASHVDDPGPQDAPTAAPDAGSADRDPDVPQPEDDAGDRPRRGPAE